MDVPPARFFKGTPMLEVLDFLERLAPFTSPDLLLRDEQPLMSAEFRQKQQPVTGGTPNERETKSPGAPAAQPDALEKLRRSLGRD
jgi:nitrous oxidase accessory protein